MNHTQIKRLEILHIRLPFPEKTILRGAPQWRIVRPRHLGDQPGVAKRQLKRRTQVFLRTSIVYLHAVVAGRQDFGVPENTILKRPPIRVERAIRSPAGGPRTPGAQTVARGDGDIREEEPISSLDHWRRRNVARRLAEEASVRQVVVFTHDTPFLRQLCDEIDAARIPNSMSFLEWRGGSPGYVNSGLPWDHQGYNKARIAALEQAQRKLARAWTVYPGENEISEMRHEYDRLRATLKRVIQDVVFNGVVKRYRIGVGSGSVLTIATLSAWSGCP